LAASTVDALSATQAAPSSIHAGRMLKNQRVVRALKSVKKSDSDTLRYRAPVTVP
jgi:hypothetical protein